MVVGSNAYIAGGYDDVGRRLRRMNGGGGAVDDLFFLNLFLSLPRFSFNSFSYINNINNNKQQYIGTFTEQYINE